MSESYIEAEYFDWLYGLICPLGQKNPNRTYTKLFRILFQTEFSWSIKGDGNRAADGMDLRVRFIDDRALSPADVTNEWMGTGCSFLEMLIGLSERAAFVTSESVDNWFWRLLKNLGLRQYNDGRHIPKNVSHILEGVVTRTYYPNGDGGLFPLRNPSHDQREVELWYQLHAYVAEHL